MEKKLNEAETTEQDSPLVEVALKLNEAEIADQDSLLVLVEQKLKEAAPLLVLVEQKLKEAAPLLVLVEQKLKEAAALLVSTQSEEDAYKPVDEEQAAEDATNNSQPLPPPNADEQQKMDKEQAAEDATNNSQPLPPRPNADDTQDDKKTIRKSKGKGKRVNDNDLTKKKLSEVKKALNMGYADKEQAAEDATNNSQPLPPPNADEHQKMDNEQAAEDATQYPAEDEQNQLYMKALEHALEMDFITAEKLEKKFEENVGKTTIIKLIDKMIKEGFVKKDSAIRGGKAKRVIHSEIKKALNMDAMDVDVPKPQEGGLERCPSCNVSITKLGMDILGFARHMEICKSISEKAKKYSERVM